MGSLVLAGPSRRRVRPPASIALDRDPGELVGCGPDRCVKGPRWRWSPAAAPVAETGRLGSQAAAGGHRGDPRVVANVDHGWGHRKARVAGPRNPSTGPMTLATVAESVRSASR